MYKAKKRSPTVMKTIPNNSADFRAYLIKGFHVFVGNFDLF
jgi:hypothetical protein